MVTVTESGTLGLRALDGAVAIHDTPVGGRGEPIRIRRKSLTIGEVWFDDAVPTLPADILLYYHWGQSVEGADARDYYSLEIALQADVADLRAAMHAETRYEVARAERRDGFVHEFWDAPDPELLDRFYGFFDEFAAARGLSPANRGWLGGYVAAGRLALSCVQHAGTPLVWHSYYQDGRWARLLQSASVLRGDEPGSRRALVGRGNRYHHWRDILWFRAAGFTMYDFGGWYTGKDDPVRLGINRFKEQFGGQLTRRWYATKAMTYRGRLFLWLRRFLLRRTTVMHMM